jgi:hypothetical protein
MAELIKKLARRFELGLLLVVSVACFRNPVVAKAGRFEIHQKDIDYKEKVIHYYYPNHEPGNALPQLVNSYTNAQILENNGYRIDEKLLEAEEERIDKNTKDPISLKEIKAIFGSDVASYRRVYILPTLADRLVYSDLFPRIQKDDIGPRKKLQKIQAQTSAGKSFQTQCSENFLEYSVNLAHLEVGILPEWIVQKYSQLREKKRPTEVESLKLRTELESEGVFPQPALVKFLNESTDKKVRFTTIETEGHVILYLVGKLPRPFPNIEKIETCMAKKLSYDSWHKDEVKKVVVETIR